MQVSVIGGSITSNTFDNIYPYPGLGADAIQLWGGQYGTAVSANVDISDNVINFNDIPAAANPTHGIRLRVCEAGSCPGIDASTIHINNNKFLDGGVRGDAFALRHQGNAATTTDAECNYWTAMTYAGIQSKISGLADVDPWSDAGMNCIYTVPTPVHNLTQSTNYMTIQAAITAANTGDVILCDAGTYPENVTLNKSLTLRGAQWGVDACGRSAGESIITAGSGILLTLVNGSGGSVIDGFTFSGGTRSIESQGGPLDNLIIQNNRLDGFTSAGMFMNDSGIDVTVHQNYVDGTSKTGGGGIVHFDQDNFDGLYFTDNCVQNGTAGTGVFVDGNHNVGISGARAPLFSGNLIDNNGTGANLGRFAFEYGTISLNTVSNNLGDGIQGGIQHSTITRNTFTGNSASGLSLTGFSGSVSSDPTRGAISSVVTENIFSGNVIQDLKFNVFQFPGTISTNSAFNNSFGSDLIAHHKV